MGRITVSGGSEAAGTDAAGPVALSAARRSLGARTAMLRGAGLEALARLATTRALVVGAGGLGSPVIALLAGSGLARLTIVDPDVVDATNLARQTLFSTADVGVAKAVIAADRARVVDPELDAVAVVGRFDAAMARDHDVVIDAADDIAVTRAISDACAELDLPWVWGTVLGFDGQVSTFRDSAGVDHHDLFPATLDIGGSCAIDGVLPALCQAVGAVMAAQVLALVAGIGTPLLGTVLSVDGSTWEWTRSPLRRAPGTHRPNAGPERVSVAELASMLAAQNAPIVVDVRTPEELETGVIAGSLVPEALPDGAEDLVVVCERGFRATTWATARIVDFPGKMRVLDGGISAWKAAGQKIS